MPKTKRDHCLKELLETEKNYVEALDMIIKNFVQVQYAECMLDCLRYLEICKSSEYIRLSYLTAMRKYEMFLKISLYL